MTVLNTFDQLGRITDGDHQHLDAGKVGSQLLLITDEVPVEGPTQDVAGRSTRNIHEAGAPFVSARQLGTSPLRRRHSKALELARELARELVELELELELVEAWTWPWPLRAL
jgi:hypothetical protein